jgi:hypothetical protein
LFIPFDQVDRGPMTLIGRNRSFEIEGGFFVDAFGGYWKWSHRLDKKIASHQKVNFSRKTKNFRQPIFLPSL